MRDLNKVYATTPALHEIDFNEAGFEWIDYNDRDSSILSWLRRDSSGKYVVCITNLTPMVRESYRLGVPDEGTYRILLSTDAEQYGGSGIGAETCVSNKEGQHGRPYSIDLTLPSLATLFLEKT